MDLNFINCRLYSPQFCGVTSIGISECGNFAAVCTKNGFIHIYNTNLWTLITCLTSRSKTYIRKVAWISKTSAKIRRGVEEAKSQINKNKFNRKENPQNNLEDYRLLTAGLDGYINEWCLRFAKLKSSVSSGGGAIFDMAVSEDERLCLLACDDCSVKVFSLRNTQYNAAAAFQEDEEDGALQFVKSIGKHSHRILSVCVPHHQNCIYIGTSNSLIKKIDINTGHALCKMKCDSFVLQSSNRKNQGAPSEDITLSQEANDVQVWKLVCMKSRDILISGDSLGNVSLWSLTTNTLLQIFSQHSTDILDICVSFDETKFFSVGVDSKISFFSFIQNKKTWKMSMQSYPHMNDITAVNITKQNEIITGSLDTTVCIFENYRDILELENCRLRLFVDLESFVSSSRCISVCQTERLIILNHMTHLDIWYLMEKDNAKDYETMLTYDESNSEKRKVNSSEKNFFLSKNFFAVKLIQIKINKNDSIQNVRISPDAKILALACRKGLKLFLFDISELEVKKISSCMQITSESEIYSLLFFTQKHLVVCAECTFNNKKKKKEKILVNVPEMQREKPFSLVFCDVLTSNIIRTFYLPYPITKIECSNDSQWIVCTDMRSNVSIYALDTFQHHCFLPRIKDNIIVSTSFHPQRNLIAAFSSNYCFYIFDLNTTSIIHSNQLYFKIPFSYLNRKDGIVNKVLWLFNNTKNEIIENRRRKSSINELKYKTNRKKDDETQNNCTSADAAENTFKCELFVETDKEKENKELLNAAEKNIETSNPTCYFDKNNHVTNSSLYKKENTVEAKVDEWIFVCCTYSKICLIKFQMIDNCAIITNSSLRSNLAKNYNKRYRNENTVIGEEEDHMFCLIPESLEKAIKRNKDREALKEERSTDVVKCAEGDFVKTIAVNEEMKNKSNAVQNDCVFEKATFQELQTASILQSSCSSASAVSHSSSSFSSSGFNCSKVFDYNNSSELARKKHLLGFSSAQQRYAPQRFLQHNVYFYALKSNDFILYVHEISESAWKLLNKLYMSSPKCYSDCEILNNTSLLQTNRAVYLPSTNELCHAAQSFRDIFTFVLSKKLFYSSLPEVFNRKRYAT